ncbi:MAG: hypothetical protein WKF71_17710 [Pyrinomonadaceae bacterium]
MKSQLIISEETEEIIATFFGKGKTHDYKLYQTSDVKLGKQIRLRGDLVLLGIAKSMFECNSAAEKQ